MRRGTVQLPVGRNIERRLVERSTERLQHGGNIARRLVELSIVRLQAGTNTGRRLRRMDGKRIVLLLFDQHTERLLKINNNEVFLLYIFLLYNLIYLLLLEPVLHPILLRDSLRHRCTLRGLVFAAHQGSIGLEDVEELEE